MAIIVLFGQRLLPERNGRDNAGRFQRPRQDAGRAVQVGRWHVPAACAVAFPVCGFAAGGCDLTDYAGLTLVAIQDGDGGPLRRAALAEGDILIVRGDAATVGSLASDKLLAFRSEDAFAGAADTLFNRSSGLAEVVIPPRSGLVGQTVFPGMVTESGDLIILAVQRRGEDRGAR